jgi:CheY-like chemotaxis protein
MREVRFKILVADDDRDDFEMLKEAFATSGEIPEFEYCENGAILLTRLKSATSSDKPDLIVLDLNMPKVDGMQALSRIRGDEELQNIPVFIHSTSTSLEQIEACRALGADAYVVKGGSFVTFRKLSLKILRFLNQQKAGISTGRLHRD